MRDILRRAERFFRADAKDAQEKLTQTISAEIMQLREQMAEIEANMETATEATIGSIMEAYEALFAKVSRLEQTLLDSKDYISEEWTTLQKALGEVPRDPSEAHNRPVANLRLVIDAIDRLKAEGELDEEGDDNQQAA